VAVVRLFARAREIAGRGRDEIAGDTVADVVAAAAARYGDAFVELLPTCRIWLNGDEVDPSTPVGESDEVAVLPPVSGGA
jgi:MoaD family protein